MTEREELIAELMADATLTEEDREEVLRGFDCHHFEDLLMQDARPQ